MVESFQNNGIEGSFRVAIHVPVDGVAWGSVGVFCGSVIPNGEFLVTSSEQQLEEFLEGVGFVFLVHPKNQEFVNKIHDFCLGLGCPLEVIVGGGEGGGGVTPQVAGRRILDSLGCGLSAEELLELEDAVWPPAEWRGSSLKKEGGESSLVFPVGMLTVIQENVVIRKPSSGEKKKPVGTERVLHPSRAPAIRVGQGRVNGEPERVMLNAGLEKPVGLQELRVNRKRAMPADALLSSFKEVEAAKEKRFELETDLRGRKKRKRKVSWRGVAIALGLVLVMGLIAIFAGMGKAWSLRDGFEQTLEAGGEFFSLDNKEDIAPFVAATSQARKETQEWWGRVGPLLPFFGHSSGEVDELLVYADRQALALNALKKLTGSSQALASSVWQGKSSGGALFATAVQSDRERALKALSELGLELQRKKEAEVGKAGQIESLLGVLRERRKILSSDQRFLSLLSEIGGEKKKKIYAVIVHDSSQLKAPEGVIAGMVLLQFEGGRLVGYQAINPFLLDEVMMASVQPPEELKRVLGVETWAFTQSNWDPDFSISSKQMKWFLEKHLKVNFDGIISLNDESLKKVLRALNGVEVASEGVVDDSDVGRVLRSEEQGRGVLTAEVMTAILKKMETASPEQLHEIFFTLGGDARSGRIIFNSSSPTLEKGVRSLGWSGDIMTPDCPVQIEDGKCFVDAFYAVDSHLGEVSTPLVEKRAEHTVSLGDGVAEHRVVLWYQNNASANLPEEKSEFRNYLRIYTPESTEKFSIKLGEEEFAGEEVVSSVEEGRRKTAFSFAVPAGVRLPVEIRYSTPLQERPPLSYALFLQRQPGVAEYPLSLVVNIEKSLSAKTVAPAADVVENVVAYDLKMNEHQFVAVEVARRE